ncbi:MAG: hypothetical protein QG566_232 [Patescibacteria group bacterium]|nr:hypothetical protein [Patescibacteria group bacterium]
MEGLNNEQKKWGVEAENKAKANSAKIALYKEEFGKGSKEIKLYNLDATEQNGPNGMGMEIYAKNFDEAKEMFESFVNIDKDLWDKPFQITELDGKFD